MCKRDFALVLVLALAAGFCGSLLAGAARRADGGDFVPAARAAGRAASAESDGAAQWEHCAVLRAQFAGSIRGEQYWISYFRGERVTVETVEAGPGGNAFSKAVNKLGNEGWEMVGQGPLEVRTGIPGQAPPAIFFKRRKEDK